MSKNNSSGGNNSSSKKSSSTTPSNPPDAPNSGPRAGADAGVGRSGDKTTSSRGGSSSGQASTSTPTPAVGVSSTSISGQGLGTIITKAQLEKAKAAMRKSVDATHAQLRAPPEQTAEDSLSEGSFGVPTRILRRQ